MTEEFWTITNPAGGSPVTLASLGLDAPVIRFQANSISKATMAAHRDFDSEDAWWDFDEEVTIYRDGVAYFTGRVQENPDTATGDTEVRSLTLADAWQDLEEIIYREEWAIGSGTQLYPRAILGQNAAGAQITTGQQISDAVAFAITQGAAMQVLGGVATGMQLWPSEVRNVSCESVIVEQMRFHPDWVAWLDHSTSPPTFNAWPKSGLDTVTIDLADENVEMQRFAEVKRTVPLGVSIVYESANTVDGEVYRSAYLDEAGVTTGRRVIRAMLDLEGMDMAFQKSRIQTRPIPSNASEMEAYFKKKWPELADLPDGTLVFSNFTRFLAPEDPHADPINTRATRLSVEAAADLPRELVRGTIEDWMRKKVGRVVLKYDLAYNPAATAEQRKILSRFTGPLGAFSVTATDAVTKIYKGITSWTAGEDRPEGLAEAIFAAATEQQYEGEVSITGDEVPADQWIGKKLRLVNGETEIMPATVIHAASAEIDAGRVTISFGPMPYLSAGDFLELQRIFNRRKVTWMSPEERTSNTLGAEGNAGSQGDIVSGYDSPETGVPPGGSDILNRQWKATQASDTTIDHTGGTLTSQAGFSPITVADVTALSATASGHVILTVGRDSSTRAISGTPAITYAAGTLPESDYNSQIIPLTKVTVTDDVISEILPLKFEELHIFEDLCVVNGEFMLADLLIAGRNIYEPPPP